MTPWPPLPRPAREPGCYRGFKATRPLVRRGPSRFDVIRAVPHQSRRLRTPRIERLYLHAVCGHPDYVGLRGDRQASIAAVAKWLARLADYETGTTRPTRARICERAGVSVSTWKMARRWLEERGFLGTVSQGCIRWHPEGEVRHDAAVYVLCAPRLEPRRKKDGKSGFSPLPATRPPTRPRRGLVTIPARAHRPKKGDRPGGRAHLQGGRHLSEWLSALPDGGRAVAQALRHGPGEILTDGWVGYLARPFVRAGWTAGDLKHAVDHLPSGAQHPYPVRDVRQAPAWIAWRLSHWIGPDGRPLPGRSQVLAAAAAGLRAEQARRREADAAAATAHAGGIPAAALAILERAGLRRPRAPDPPARPDVPEAAVFDALGQIGRPPSRAERAQAAAEARKRREAAQSSRASGPGGNH